MNQPRTSEGTSSARRILKVIPELDTRSLLRHARTLFDVEDVPAHVQRHNRRAWARSVQMLGNRWVLAVPQERYEP